MTEKRRRMAFCWCHRPVDTIKVSFICLEHQTLARAPIVSGSHYYVFGEGQDDLRLHERTPLCPTCGEAMKQVPATWSVPSRKRRKAWARFVADVRERHRTRTSREPMH